MNDYQSNSYRSREKQKEAGSEKKPVEKIITGKAKVRKKNEIRKFADVIISEDAGNVKNWLVQDVLIPTIKNTIIDMVIYIFGDGSHRSKSGSMASKVSYSSYYDRKNGRNRDTTRTKTGYSYDEITLDTKTEAEDVLARLDELIETYGMASVADLYDLVGVTGHYTDNKYGWMNIRNADIKRDRYGWTLKLPKALPLD